MKEFVENTVKTRHEEDLVLQLSLKSPNRIQKHLFFIVIHWLVSFSKIGIVKLSFASTLAPAGRFSSKIEQFHFPTVPTILSVFKESSQNCMLNQVRKKSFTFKSASFLETFLASIASPVSQLAWKLIQLYSSWPHIVMLYICISYAYMNIADSVSGSHETWTVFGLGHFLENLTGIKIAIFGDPRNSH